MCLCRHIELPPTLFKYVAISPDNIPGLVIGRSDVEEPVVMNLDFNNDKHGLTLDVARFPRNFITVTNDDWAYHPKFYVGFVVRHLVESNREAVEHGCVLAWCHRAPRVPVVAAVRGHGLAAVRAVVEHVLAAAPGADRVVLARAARRSPPASSSSIIATMAAIEGVRDEDLPAEAELAARLSLTATCAHAGVITYKVSISTVPVVNKIDPSETVPMLSTIEELTAEPPEEIPLRKKLREFMEA